MNQTSNYNIEILKDSIDMSCSDQLRRNVHLHVYNGDIMWATLNQTDLESNSNKYYIMQLLKHDIMDSYFIISRSGRVGYENKKEIKCFLKENKAIEDFNNEFYDRTGYLWKDRLDMIKKKGKYDYVEMKINDECDKIMKFKSSESNVCDLDVHVEKLVKMIFDIEMFHDTMEKLSIDVTSAPLGKISSKQINKAYGILSQIQELIKNNVEMTDKQYVTLSSEFYTFIPTSHGNQKLPIIVTEPQIKEKMELLKVLSEMEIVNNILSQMSPGLPQTMQQYKSLKSEIKVVTDREWIDIIQLYVKQTKGRTHNYDLSIRQIFEVNRENEKHTHEKNKNIGNCQLLWHGSRISNIASIISQGLRIAPPEAPSTGYMFGKGVYFANAVTKSAQYMHAENGTGIILLCEVFLGNPYKKTKSEYIKKLPIGYDSTWGMGRLTTNNKEKVITNDGVIVPCGHLIESNVVDTSLSYDEYIVYDVSQIKIKYAIILDVKKSKSCV